ncbi:MAG: SprB repeat-containing protein, partial [Flavobacteriia bacterium]
MSVRYQTNAKGSINIISNTSLKCSAGNNCTTAQNEIPPAGTWGNHSLTMGYVDIDNDATTYMSSSDSIVLPNCSEVLWAGIYWAARISAATTNYANRSQVKLKLNTGAYQTLTADQTMDVPTINGQSWSHPSYYCYKNITSIVAGAGLNTRYTLANLVSQSGGNSWGGWSIVVVYKNALQSMRNLTVFDGLANVNQNTVLNIPFSGFTTPPTGPVNFQLGLIAYDGDRDLQGDFLQFNGVTVSDATHSATNFFNSSYTYNGVLTPFRNPNYNNTLGNDASIFSPNNTALNFLGNNATSATLSISTNQDVIIPRTITSAIDIYEPDLRATVYVQDLNGGQVVPGDILEYTMVGKNIGSDVSNNTFMVDTLDIRTTYVPGSISYVNGPFIGAKTDVSGDDQAEYDAVNKCIKARVKTGANAIIGGAMQNSPNGADSAVVKYRVQVINDCLLFNCDSTLENKAYIFGAGNISGNLNTNNGISDFYNVFGCPTTSNNQLTIHSGCPPVGVTHNDPLCIGDSLIFSVPFSPLATYAWAGPNGFTSTSPSPTLYPVSPSIAGVYQLNITFSGSTCAFFNLLDTVVVHPNPTINLVNLSNVTCFNFANGSIQIAANSTAPYTYSWSNSATTPTISNLGPGTYTVTATDAFTCQSNATYQIIQPTLLIASATVTSNYNGQQISCFNASDGIATVVPSGGTLPYSYLWSNGQTTAVATGLNIGTYSVIVTDANGCTAFDTVFLTQPTPIVLSTTHTDVTCFGGFNGSISLSATGGTFPYTFNWSNNTNNQNATNLPAGNFTVIVTDVNGCSQNTGATILQPALPITPTQTHVDVGCYGDATGSINLSVIGGTPGYTYSWNVGATTQDLNNLPFGIYTVFITDANNCIGQLSMVVNQPAAPLSNSAVITPVGCFGGSNGAINMGVSGGTNPYTYIWSNGMTQGIISGLPTGTYSVNVTDANGCLLLGSYFVGQPLAPLSVSASHADIFCFGASTGSVDLTPVGGTQPYSYFWSNGFVSQDLNNIPAGTYSVTVQDANGCQDTISQTVIQLSQPILLSETHQDVLCNGFATGTVNLTVAGGTPNYSYSWSNGSISQDISNLLAGSYTVVVTDANFCTDSLTAVISQPLNALIITETHVNPSCIGGTSGNINLSVSGGVPSYTYLWNNGETTQDIDTLLSGIYQVMVSDANGCQIPFTVPLLDPSNGMALSHTFGNVNCFGGADGFVDLTVTGGNPNYFYTWSNGSVMQDIFNLAPGNYFVSVVDVIGCGLFLSQMITEPDSALNVSSSYNDVPCYGDSTGSVVLNVSGGTLPYGFLWSTGSTQQNLLNLPIGTYSVTITDANGCTQYITDTLSQPPGELVSSYLQTNVTCFGTNTGAVNLTVSGGIAPYSYAWTNGSASQDITNVPAGTYTVTVTDAVGCSHTHTITITQPANALSLTFANTNVSC